MSASTARVATSRLNWSPDEKHVIYAEDDSAGGTIYSRDPTGGPPISILSPPETQGLSDYNWLSDGRLVYTLPGAGPIETCNYWALRVDLHTGQRVGGPAQITHWPGFCVGGLTSTANGKRLAFTKGVAFVQAHGSRSQIQKMLSIARRAELHRPH